MRVSTRLLIGQHPCAHLLCHPGVVVGQLAHLPIADQVYAAITNVGDIRQRATSHHCNACCSHASAPSLLSSSLIDHTICLFDGMLQSLDHSIRFRLIIFFPNGLYRHLAGTLTGCMPTHTIGHHKDRPFALHDLGILGDVASHIIFIGITSAANI